MLKQIMASFSLIAIALATFSISAIAQESLLEEGMVIELVAGDLMCYATLVDDDGKEYSIGAKFEICDDRDFYLDQRVRLTYEEVNVNDCESSEPCGKTRKEQVISEMEVIE
ncbi:hypothetical protein [Okeania sp.]|uniref:hypothetical protein n=1 Tax=Okeania sp. TaxID=3100323 RepID=UPI002B4B8285|nr:hypothetical protein [Okeania sp.]MEB3342939.1 hypothetical protein [Okeania sp.]